MSNDGSAFVGSHYFNFFLIFTAVLTSGSSHGWVKILKQMRSVRHGEVSGNTPKSRKRLLIALSSLTFISLRKTNENIVITNLFTQFATE